MQARFSLSHQKSLAIASAFVLLTGLLACQPGLTAENISLRKGISFIEDKDNGFPIVADNMADTTVETGKPNLLFFGASGDLNTARQAKRLVGTYNKLRNKGVKFIVINVDKPANKGAEDLIKKHYKGYIPCQTVLDQNGSTTWSKVGEVSEKEVTKALIKNLKK